MLLNAVILVLREVIEAALLISLFLSFSQIYGHSKKVASWGLVTGLLFAVIYAFNIRSISQWVDGSGQELINAGIAVLIYFSLLIFVTTAQLANSKSHPLPLSFSIMVTVALATMQEGTEIILYLHGFSSTAELFRPVLFGALIGAGIGLSAGIFIYYLLINAPRKVGLRTGFTLLLLTAGSMTLQAIQQLTQIDWIPSQYPLWNSSAWISEHSLTGQLLYAVIGYEATPTLTQVISYLISLSLIIALSYYVHFRQQGRSHV